jgi:hypothetical protein
MQWNDAFSTDVVPEENFTPAPMLQRAYPTTTTTAATVTTTKATLSSCSSMALSIVISYQN